MKKFKAFLLAALVLAIAIIAAPAEAYATEEELVLIYAQVPDNWETPRVWAWGPRGDAFPAWPGGEMQPDPNNPGWYFIYIPADKTGALISADVGDDREQINDFGMDGQAIWVTVHGEGDDFEYTREQQTEGDLPEPVLTYIPADEPGEMGIIYLDAAVVFAYIPEHWVNPRIWAWGPRGDAFDEWPGGEMSPDQNNPGWYYAFIPDCMVGALVSADVEGGDEDEREQIIDFAFTGAPVWVTINANDDSEATTDQLTEGDIPVLAGGFPFLAPAEPEAAPDVGYITVRAYITDTWDTPGVWAWNDGDGIGSVFPGWPGQPFTERDGIWHVMELPGWIDHIIINADGGSTQTDDLEVVMGEDIWMMIMGPDAVYLSHEAFDPEEADVEVPERVEVAFGADPIEEVEEDEVEEVVEDDDDNGAPVVLIIVIVAAVVVVLGICGVLIAKKKKQ